MDELISVKQGKALTGYSGGYLRQLAIKGRIEARKIGNSWALNTKSLLHFANGQKRSDGRYGPRSKQK